MKIKTNSVLKSLWGILAALTVVLGLTPRPAQAVSNEPYAAIESIQVDGTNIVVDVAAMHKQDFSTWISPSRYRGRMQTFISLSPLRRCPRPRLRG